MMTAIKRIFAFLFLIAAASCIDPYTPNIKGYKSLLVVEGFISNENSSYKVKLQRTTNEESTAPSKVNDANVYITDGDGIKIHLQNCGEGNYKTDSTLFIGEIGKKYTLQILTSDGKEYKSEECTMLPVTGIDSVYYEKGEEITGIQGEMLTGIKIFLNSADATGMNQYFRWTFEETWKFHLAYPQKYNCLIISIDPTIYLFEEVPVIKEICWKKSQSEEIITNSVLLGETNHINRQLIKFIAPSKSDRLTHQFSILVKQYSISEKEYNFWNNLKKVSEAGGDIFDSQPYQVISNVHNVNDAGEMVLGYFEVSAVSRKRIFIAAHQLDTLYLPHYQTDCVEIIKSPGDWPSRNPPTFWEIYHMFMDTGDYTFVRYILNSDLSLQKLVFAPNTCSKCEYAGFSEKPDFWIDLE
jgi:hypothetical protein